MFQNLARIRSELGTVDFPDISKQALSKARQFINPSLFKELYYLSVDIFYKLIPSRKLWNGYHLFAIDGSKIELLNSKSNFDFFGEMFGYPDPERRFTMGLASVVYDVLDNYVVHTTALYLFCGRRNDRIKALLHENDGFVLLYKRLDHNTGKYRWTRNRDEVKTITWRQFDWLMSGLEIEQPKAIKSA